VLATGGQRVEQDLLVVEGRRQRIRDGPRSQSATSCRPITVGSDSSTSRRDRRRPGREVDLLDVIPHRLRQRADRGRGGGEQRLQVRPEVEVVRHDRDPPLRLRRRPGGGGGRRSGRDHEADRQDGEHAQHQADPERCGAGHVTSDDRCRYAADRTRPRSGRAAAGAAVDRRHQLTAMYFDSR
jgi:hypothetical protein